MLMLISLLLYQPLEIKVDKSDYLDFFQKGRDDFFKKKNFNQKDRFFVTNINVNFWKEIKKDDELAIITRVALIDKKSFKLKQLIYCKKMLISDATITIIIFDSNNKIKELPEELIKILK